MTDARLPERWLYDRRFLRLSDAAYRLYTVGLLWAVTNRTDGRLDADDMPLMPGVIDPGKADELERAGLWKRTDNANGWFVVDFPATQTSRSQLAVLENMQRRDREKKARQRAAKKAGSGKTGQPASPGMSPGDSPGGHPGDASRGAQRQGKARPKDNYTPTAPTEGSRTREADDPPAAARPSAVDLDSYAPPDWRRPT